MDKDIVKINKFPITTWEIEKVSEDDHKAILKGASIEIPWGNERIVLKKLTGGWVDDTLTNKTNAKKNKLKISELPVAYQIQQFNFSIIPLYKIIK